MSNTLKIGNVVHLNSGSPDLKVVGYCDGCQTVRVEWQTNAGLRWAHFPSACLSIAGRAGAVLNLR